MHETRRPRLLDLFGGAQGCGVGYARAGFVVTSLDITPHDRHPDVAEFVVGDALGVDPAWIAAHFDAVHASPPCQAGTTMSNRWRGKGGKADSHVNLIPPTRDLLVATGLPYVIENVPGFRRELHNPITLHGGMFGLGVHRPRLFEAPWLVFANPPAHPPHDPLGVYGREHDGRRLFTRADGTHQRAPRTLDEARAAMGIDWMSWDDLREAIPPAYTQWIGEQLLEVLAVTT